MEATSTTVLAISRQMGAGGAYIGKAVAERLGMKYADREILDRAARESGFAEREIEDSEERTAGLWHSLVRSFSFGAAEAPAIAPLPPALYEKDVFDLESRIIREVAGRFDTVIVGRASFHVLADHPGRVAVLIYAEKDWRLRRLLELYPSLDEEKARALIEESDPRREHFVKAVTGGSTLDAVFDHDLCINTGRVGLERATEMVVGLVSQRMKERRAPA